MSLSKKRNREWIRKKTRQGFRGYPLATIAYYGPTDQVATKVAVGFAETEEQEPDVLERYYSESPDADIRYDADIQGELGQLLKQRGVKSVAMTDRIIGCAHEEGIDYPEGELCPQCPFWKNRDRWTGNTLE